MKIYTKTGDTGKTSLFGGERVDKDNLRIDAYGNIDELNSLIGEIIAYSNNTDIKKKLTTVQERLMVLGSDLASPINLKIKIPRVNKSFITTLEKEIDYLEKQLPSLKNFILPGGSITASKLHLARSITRRSERSISSLIKKEEINPNIPVFINRLSDWFFVLARYVNLLENQPEKLWSGRNKK